MKSLPQNAARILETLASVIVPEYLMLDAEARGQCLNTIDAELGERPASTRRQLAVFLTLVSWLPLVRFGTRLEQLGSERQRSVLRFLQDSPVALLRKGTWGLKTLVFMGYYTRVQAAQAIGYAPDFDGNKRLHADKEL